VSSDMKSRMWEEGVIKTSKEDFKIIKREEDNKAAEMEQIFLCILTMGGNIEKGKKSKTKMKPRIKKKGKV